MHLSGQLSDWSINDLLQIMQVTKKTGSLDIEGQRRGRVHFREGRVTGAELTGVRGAYTGIDRGGIADILYVLSTVDEGSFSVGAADGPDATGWTVEEVLLDVGALQSLEGEVVDAGLFEADAVKLVPEIGDPVTIAPDDWQIFVNLVPSFTFSALESQYGRGGAVRIFHTLHRLGLAETAAAGDAEVGWVEETSDQLSPEPQIEEWTEAEPITDPTEPRDLVGEEAGRVFEVDESEEEAEAEPVALTATKPGRLPSELKGVSAPASTTLTDGVYDEIRRLRSRVGDK